MNFIRIIQDVEMILLVAGVFSPVLFGLYAAGRLLFHLSRNDIGLLLLGVLFPALSGAALVWLSVKHLQTYGFSLFSGLPFYIGVLSSVIFSIHGPRPYRDCLGVTTLALLLLGGLVILIALDGVVCILMAMPLAFYVAFVGAIVANVVMQSRHRSRMATPLLLLCASLPFIMEFEAGSHFAAPGSEVVTSVDIAASARTIWKFIPAIPSIPDPPEAILRTGVAYPLRSEMIGTGLGARRLCILSTWPDAGDHHGMATESTASFQGYLSSSINEGNLDLS